MASKFCVACRHELENYGIICPWCGRDPNTGDLMKRVKVKGGYWLTAGVAFRQSFLRWLLITLAACLVIKFFDFGSIWFILPILTALYGLAEAINNYLVVKADGAQWIKTESYEWESSEG